MSGNTFLAITAQTFLSDLDISLNMRPCETILCIYRYSHALQQICMTTNQACLTWLIQPLIGNRVSLKLTAIPVGVLSARFHSIADKTLRWETRRQVLISHDLGLLHRTVPNSALLCLIEPQKAGEATEMEQCAAYIQSLHEQHSNVLRAEKYKRRRSTIFIPLKKSVWTT